MFFFLQSGTDLQSNWNTYLNNIPQTAQQKEDELYYKSAGASRLDKYDYFNILDSLAKTYSQYNHNDIYNMPYEMVMNLLAYNKEKGFINSNYHEIKNKKT